ncbi:hypothetical protein HAX54_036818 [Datura stramonium]|uniref:Uncharacterized protein n=1 Tax=Datura stramonium TaxID=4076 RepID=A0ABS8RMT4_DATST|nr:hypothetical protein [Datura stramonium]
MATKKLNLMGPVTKNEWVMIGTAASCSVSVGFRDAIGIASVVAAMLGLSILLVLGVLDWDDCLSEKNQHRILWLGWPGAFAVLQVSYFCIHYLLQVKRGVRALYSAFLAMHLASGVPNVLAALALAYNTNLFGALTHYSSGQAAVFFGAGHVDLPDNIFKMGFVMALVNAIIWGVVGTFWWKFLGLY